MSIKSFFNRIAEQRDVTRKYKALVAAIKADDLEGVKKALADGAKAGYFPGSDVKKIPLTLALKKGNTAIFDTLLSTEDGLSAAFIWYSEFRTLRRMNMDTHAEGIYFTPSYLYTAIETGKEDIALLLAKHSGVDVERSGDVFTSTRKWDERGKFKDMVKTPLELAREKGMNRVVEAIEERMKPLLVMRAVHEADALTKQADEKRAEAEKLLAEASALQGKAEQKRKPSTGLNL